MKKLQVVIGVLALVSLLLALSIVPAGAAGNDVQFINNSDSSVITANQAVCWPDAKPIPVSIKVIGQAAKLLVEYRIVKPVNSGPTYKVVKPIADGQVVDLTTLLPGNTWPGIKAGDTSVEVLFGATLLDASGKVLAVRTLDHYWYPYICQDCSRTILSDEQTKIDGNNAKLAYVHPSWPKDIKDAKWIWKTQYVSTPQDGEGPFTFTRTFHFDMPKNPVIFEPTLQSGADNAYCLYFNEDPDGSPLARHPEPITPPNYSPIPCPLTADAVKGDDYGWDKIEKTTPTIKDGENTILVQAVNYHLYRGSITSNPAAIIFRLDIKCWAKP